MPIDCLRARLYGPLSAFLTHDRYSILQPKSPLLMFKLRRPSSSPYVVYPSSLFSLDQGYALWYPEPHESGEVQVGDVGYIREGAFIRLFNIDVSAPEKKVTFWRKAFEITDPPPPDVFQLDRRSRPLVPDHYCSHGVERKETRASVDMSVHRFTCTRHSTNNSQYCRS